MTLLGKIARRIREDDATGCWIWTGYRNLDGYGVIVYPGGKGAKAYAHRWVYEQLIGPVPDGLELDHLCRTPACCKPEHLEPVTPRENKRRQMRATCRRGHPMDDAYQRSDGGRLCRQCNTLRNAARRRAS